MNAQQALWDARSETMQDQSTDWLFEAESAVCEHQWHVDVSIGPDSGSETMTCRRCGMTHEIIWY